MTAALHLDICLESADFSLQVQQSLPLVGVTAFFGPSGSGKTSLLRVIAGFVRARGRVAFGEEVWQDAETFLPPHRRPAGFLFQDGRLFGHLDVAGNLRFAARRATQPTSYEGVVQALDLGPLLHRGIKGLSGGEIQRVALARTLLSGPRLLLLDEPLAALDAVRKQDIFPYLERIVGELHTPALYVSHSVDEVVRLAENVLVLVDGRVQDYGRVQQILPGLRESALPDPQEAGAVLHARVARQDSDYHLTYLQLGAQQLTVSELTGRSGQPVRLQVRDRDVALALTRPEGTSIRNILDCSIVRISEGAGPYGLVTLDLEGQLLQARVTRAAVAELELRPGQSVFALIKAMTLSR